jgi:hypothetical protein
MQNSNYIGHKTDLRHVLKKSILAVGNKARKLGGHIKSNWPTAKSLINQGHQQESEALV